MELASCIQAIEPRHGNIQHDDLRIVLLYHRQKFPAIFGRTDDVALGLKDLP
jgi:hypothetical protein